MATAIAIGSILASSGSAVAGAVGAVGTAATLGKVAAGIGLVGQAFSMFQGADSGQAAYDAQIAASRAELDAAKVRAAETGLSAQRENTQAAIEEAERQRRLRRTLAAQRASFAGAGVDPDSGSPVAIQEATAGEINRESRLADLATQDTVSSLNRQSDGILAQGAGNAASLIGKANTDLAVSRQNTLNQATQLASNAVRFAGTL